MSMVTDGKKEYTYQEYGSQGRTVDIIHNYYLKSKNKTYDKVREERKDKKAHYYHKGKLIKTRDL